MHSGWTNSCAASRCRNGTAFSAATFTTVSACRAPSSASCAPLSRSMPRVSPSRSWSAGPSSCYGSASRPTAVCETGRPKAWSRSPGLGRPYGRTWLGGSPRLTTSTSWSRCLCAAYGTLLRARDSEAERAVSASVYEAVFADPLAFQNALIRDHARCILELAGHDGVLPGGIDLAAVRAPLKSEWHLQIPSEEEVERYRASRWDYPRLHTSCLHDDFFTYILSRLESYQHALPRTAMGRWVLHHVVDEMGYGGEALASYDKYMIHYHGGGRGRPVWAERIGKKYQWIALARLAARLADHVEPRRRSWDPELAGVPLTYEQGRDIDPSLLATDRPEHREGPSWWMPEGYDFGALSSLPNGEWASRMDDLPRSSRLLGTVNAPDGQQWLLLEGYPQWSARSWDEDDDTPYRQIWMHVRGYLVAGLTRGRPSAGW